MRKLKLDELGRLSTQEFRSVPKVPFVLVLNNIRSLNNVGSAFRTADAFRIEKVILSGITGKPPHREIQKTALGATETVEWSYEKEGVEAVKKLKNQGYKIISVEQTTESIPLHRLEIESNSKIAAVFGNEVEGVDLEIIRESDQIVEIPQLGTKHSFNVAVSIGIVLWDMAIKGGYIK